MAFENYVFYPGCSHSDGIVVTSDGDPTLWEYNEDMSLLEEICGGPIGAKLVKSDVGDFDWEVFVLDADDNTLARFELVHVWRPNCRNKFKLVECDETCDTVVWQPYICVAPHVPMCPETGVRSVMFTSNFTGFTQADVSLTVPPECPFPRPLLPSPTFVYSEIEWCGPGECSWPAMEGDGFTYLCPGFEIEFTLTASMVVCIDLTRRRVVCGFVISESHPTVPPVGAASYSGAFVGPDGVLSGTIPMFEPDGTHRFDLIGFEYNINGQDCPSSCTGGSRWILRRAECEDADVYMYSWELFDNDCDGQCFTASCVPAIPEVPALPPDPIDDATATSSGLNDYLPADPDDVQEEELVNGNCLCQEEYEPTTCCTGESIWTLRRQVCYSDGENYYLYYWEFESSTCGGPCVDGEATCTYRPPYPLSTDPITDGEATSLGYLPDALNAEDDTGTCDCLDAYAPPSCPECDCDLMTANKTFTMGAYTFTLVKGAAPCGADPCCWSGSDGANGLASMAFNYGVGQWEMTVAIEDPESPGNFLTASYTGGSEPCQDPIVLDFAGGDPGFDWPASITVNSV